MLKKIVIVLALSFSVISTNVYAGYLVMNATVTSVANSGNNAEMFSIITTGSTSGPCSGVSITFSRANSGSDEIYKRAYATAMVALITGMKIYVYDYTGDNCNNAAFIQILK